MPTPILDGAVLLYGVDSNGVVRPLLVGSDGSLSGGGGASLSTNNPANIGYAPAPGSGTAASKDDHVHDTVLTVVNNVLGAPVTMTTAGTYYDGPSVSLVAGIWLVVGHITVQQITTPNPTTIAKLWDGTTVYASTEVANDVTGYRVSIALNAIITLVGTTTVKISATNSTNDGTILSAALAGGTPGSASVLNAVRVG